MSHPAFEMMGRVRKGNTGIWHYVLTTGEGKILARSSWGTNYEFNRKEWEALPVISFIVENEPTKP